MLPTGLLAGSGSNVWTLTISSDTANVNIKDELEALYGTMTTAVDAVVTVNSGVRVYSTTDGQPAMYTGSGWPSGSKLRLNNYGKIRGRGGEGGGMEAGGDTGSDALELAINVTIDQSTTGNLFGGGGGGGGGEKAPGAENVPGGGGGGQGDVGGTGGVSSGNSGQNGSASAPGEPGDGINAASGGGRGGYWGTYGSYGGAYGSEGPLPGGAPGYAVRKNGKSITWVAGNNATQVKGSVA